MNSKPYVPIHLRTEAEKDSLLFGKAGAKLLNGELPKESKKRTNDEQNLQTKICQWLTNTYPDIIFFSDFAAGLHLTPFLASVRKKQSCIGKYPDLTILKPLGRYNGLIIEIKKESASPYLKNGSLSSNEHIQGQAEMLRRLNNLGYYATFGVGEDKIKSIILNYLDGKL